MCVNLVLDYPDRVRVVHICDGNGFFSMGEKQLINEYFDSNGQTILKKDDYRFEQVLSILNGSPIYLYRNKIWYLYDRNQGIFKYNAIINQRQ